MTPLTEARRLFDAGLALLPNHPRDKYPKVEGWQSAAFDWPTLEQHLRAGGALGLRQGDDGGETVDLDCKYWLGDPDELRQQYEGLVEDHAPGLLGRLVIQQTRSGGRHYIYRCATIEGNLKLAERPPTDAELEANPKARAVTLIETRGRGGQIQIAPSPGYTVVQGDLAAIPTISAEERAILLACARMLTQIAAPSAIDRQAARLPRLDGDELPGDVYNANGGADEALRLLEADGWVEVKARGAVRFLRRPGKQRGVSATFGYHGAGVLHVFSSNASPFEPGHAYSPFAIRALLQHGGDYSAAAKAIAEEHGLPYYPAGLPLEQGGALCCPKHRTPLRAGKRAAWLYCPHPDPKAERGYCTYGARVPGYRPPEPSEEAAPAAADDDGRPQIDRTTIDLKTITPLAWDAVVAANDPPTLFRRGLDLVRLEENDSGARVVQTVDTRRMTGILARAARWVRVSHTRQGALTTDTTPPAAVVDDCMVNIDPRIPVLMRVIHAPTFAGDALLSEPGYHAAARVYYDPRPGDRVPPVPVEPSAADLAEARALVLDDLLADFPFVSDADRAHAVALLLLPFVRELIDGPTPLHLVEAPTMGSGKGLLAEVLLMPALGEPPSPMTEAPSDEEWRKTITANLLTAPTAIYIDNLNRMLDSGSLAAALTAREFSNRMLGTMDQVSLPVRCVWVATANNPTLSTEISRRCIRIRIDPRVDKPWEREGFRHPRLRSWVEANRGRLVWAALVLCRYGLRHGKPGRALGSYEAWSDVLGRILEGCGIPGFLGNLDALYDRADSEGAAWRALVAAWWQAHGDEPKPAGDLFPLVAEADADVLINGRDEVGRKKSFGKALARVQDRVFSVDIDGTPTRLQIAEGGVRHKAKLWRLVKVGVLGVLGVSANPTRGNISRSGSGYEETPKTPITPTADDEAERQAAALEALEEFYAEQGR